MRRAGGPRRRRRARWACCPIRRARTAASAARHALPSPANGIVGGVRRNDAARGSDRSARTTARRRPRHGDLARRRVHGRDGRPRLVAPVVHEPRAPWPCRSASGQVLPRGVGVTAGASDQEVRAARSHEKAVEVEQKTCTTTRCRPRPSPVRCSAETYSPVGVAAHAQLREGRTRAPQRAAASPSRHATETARAVGRRAIRAVLSEGGNCRNQSVALPSTTMPARAKTGASRSETRKNVPSVSPRGRRPVMAVLSTSDTNWPP